MARRRKGSRGHGGGGFTLTGFILKLLFTVVIVVLILTVGCQPAPTSTSVPPPVPPTPTLAPSSDAVSKIKALTDALNAGNVDAAVAFYTDDAIQTQQPPPAGQSGVRTGKEQISGFVKGLVADHFSVELSNLKVAGDKITYTCTFSTDTYRKLGVAPLVTVEEAVFEGGKIKSQPVTVTPESLAKIQAAMAAAQANSAPSAKKVLVLLSVESSQAMEHADQGSWRNGQYA